MPRKSKDKEEIKGDLDDPAQRSALDLSKRTGVLRAACIGISGPVHPLLVSAENLHGAVLPGNDLDDASSLFKIPSLKEISLSRNPRLNAIPADCGSLVNLVKIDIGGCAVDALPAGVGKWTSLRVFNAADNKIASLPKEFALLVSLERIDLSGNELTVFPPEITALAAAAASGSSSSGSGKDKKGKNSAKKPSAGKDTGAKNSPRGDLNSSQSNDSNNLGNNNVSIEDGPRCKLVTVNVSRNAITEFPCAFLGQVTECLETFDISKNKIEGKLPRDSLPSMKKLKTLVMAGNDITSIAGAIFPFVGGVDPEENAENDANNDNSDGPAGAKKSKSSAKAAAGGGGGGTPRKKQGGGDGKKSSGDFAVVNVPVEERFPALSTLDVSSCALKNLSMCDCSPLESLERLVVSRNGLLKSLPSRMSMVPRLNTILATNCDIMQIPIDIGLCGSLRTLMLGGNGKLSALPGSLAECVALEKMGVEMCTALIGTELPREVAEGGAPAIRSFIASRAEAIEDAAHINEGPREIEKTEAIEE